jgi:hypothetical protein
MNQSIHLADPEYSSILSSTGRPFEAFGLVTGRNRTASWGVRADPIVVLFGMFGVISFWAFIGCYALNMWYGAL